MTGLVKADGKATSFGCAQLILHLEGKLKTTNQSGGRGIEGKKAFLNQKKYLRWTLLLNSPQRKKAYIRQDQQNIITQQP